MLHPTTNWPRLYSIAAVLGGGFGLLLSIGALPSAPEWPGEWGVTPSSPLRTILVPVVSGAVIGLVLAGMAHLGVRYQLRRGSRR